MDLNTGVIVGDSDEQIAELSVTETSDFSDSQVGGRSGVASDRTAVAIRGSAWSIGGYIATQLLRTAATLVLARHFIGPEAFGLVGLVGVFLAGP